MTRRRWEAVSARCENLAASLQLALDAGAERVLLPMSFAGDLTTVPPELFSKFQVAFCADPVDAAWRVRRAAFGDRVKVNVLLNAKSGICAEDCAYCSQAKGADTGVGKTLVSALLCRAWNAAYWKPLQTGAADGDDDARTVAELAGLSPERTFAPARVYQAPASPEWAATLEQTRVGVAEVLACRPPPGGPLVVEGAGGVLVPLNERETTLDLMQALAAPVVVVARSGLGTVNHTLLTLEALRRQALTVHGVVLSGPLAPHTRAAIERHGGVRVLAEVPPLGEVTAARVAETARELSFL